MRGKSVAVENFRNGHGDWRGCAGLVAGVWVGLKFLIGLSLPIAISGAAPDPPPSPTPGPTPTPWTVTNTLHLPVVETNRPGAR